ncbi:formin-like protein 1 isoform X2 [Denticeps clupeoides]|uniref:formin-like protein 1 isoform X2 n=1 Tax=Denticeps clupeoides TaxID=299321 RepID=UPI0010A3E605|nr:formin-like protein 1 isoform X2 [Denticeps clupeoides]
MGNAAGSLELPSGREERATTGPQKPPAAPKLPIPPEEELEERFSVVLNSMNLPADKVKLLHQYDNEKKWELVCDQERFQVKNPPSAYLSKLKSFLEQGDSRKFKRRVQESTQVLRELEISLRTNHIGWAQEFLNEENKGLDVLVEYLTFAQCAVTFDMDSLDNGDVVPGDKNKIEKSVEDLTRSASNSPTHNATRAPRALAGRINSVYHRKALRNSRIVSLKDDAHVCIMCLRAIMNYQYGFNQVMTHPRCVNEITLSLNNKSPRTKAQVLELLAAVCLVRGGHDIILSALDNFKEVCGERWRFEKLMEYFCQEDSNIDFTVACMQFINIVVHSVENMNFRVHLQYEFTHLGLDDYLERLKQTESERLQVQIQAYLDNVFDVGSLLEDAETKNALLEHLEEVQERNVQLNGRLQECEKGAEAKVSDLEKQLIQTSKEVELLKERLRESCAQVAALEQREREKDLEREREREEARERECERERDGNQECGEKLSTIALSQLEQKVQELVDQGLIRMERSASGTLDISMVPITVLHSETPAVPQPGADKVAANPQPPPPPPLPPPLGSRPPPPPPLGGSVSPSAAQEARCRKPIQTKYRMPLFNWQALKAEQVAGTVFTELDDEHILRELNMDSFEEKFKTKAQSAPTGLGTLKMRTAQRAPSKVALMEPNRAKNLAITLRKGGMSASDICTAIETYDLNSLSLDFLELLERFIPSEHEQRQIQSYEREGRPLDELSEEDRFMARFGRIPRLAQRISTLTFMGNFSESVRMLRPLDAVIAASMSIKSSTKLKKILEIILAFGNYMNSGKRGAAYGFRLQSLDLLLDTKSTDRKQTLLHFIVSIIQEKYPQLQTFYTELRFVDKASLVSLDSILQDVRSLEKGMDVARKELQEQEESSVLRAFLSSNETLLETVVKDSGTAQEVYESAVEYFGENPKANPPSMFFPVFIRFIKAYKQAEEDNEERSRKGVVTKDEGVEMHSSPLGKTELSKVPAMPKLPHVDLIAELKKKQQVSSLVREGKDGAIEDIITGLRNQPYVRADGGRRSAKWKTTQQLQVSSDISL